MSLHWSECLPAPSKNMENMTFCPRIVDQVLNPSFPMGLEEPPPGLEKPPPGLEEPPPGLALPQEHSWQSRGGTFLAAVLIPCIRTSMPWPFSE